MFATSCNNGSIVVSVLHIHPVLWLNSRLLSKEIPQTQSSTRTASKRSFHFNKTLKAKQLFQKRGMAKRGYQTFFSAFDLGVWGAHLCQTCSTQLPSTSQWEETVLNQYSSMLFYALATTHELLMTSLPAVAQAWFGPSSTNRIKPTSWQCPTHRRFFSLVLLLHLKPELRPKFAAIFVGSPGEHLAGLYKFYTNDAIAMQIMQDSFLSLVWWPMPSLSLWVTRHLGSPVCFESFDKELEVVVDGHCS